MNNVMDDLARLHNKKHRYDIDLINVEKDKDYVIYNDLIFEDGDTLYEYIHENESDDFDTIEELENYCDTRDMEIKTGEELLKEIINVTYISNGKCVVRQYDIIKILDKYKAKEDKSPMVNDFKWEKGKNDIEYIKLLEKHLQNQKELTGKAISKLHEPNPYKLAWEEYKLADGSMSMQELEKKHNIGSDNNDGR